MQQLLRRTLEVPVHERGENFVIGSWRSLFVMYWIGGPSLHALDRMEHHEDALLRRHPEGITSLFVIREIRITRPPTGEVKRRADELASKYFPHLVGTAQVVDGSGFSASMARTFLTAVTLFGRSQAPTKVFGDIGSATRWIGRLPSQDAGIAERAGELEGAVSAMV
ncbi:MAG TPA: hypothetical protein RMH99_11305 [Sandaracinaceae bacterium LLY-WYZ-13_1]|nr:hypothetical protein [Sandaracinaceae bacterium LLY-WYZ-13_1]